MRFKTLVLIPAIAVLATYVVSLPVAQNQISANAPQNEVVDKNKIKNSIRTAEKATEINEIIDERSKEKISRSKNREKVPDSNVEANKAFANSYMESKYSWGEDQYSCLVNLWNRESGWRHTADNPTSSAYGIPQALPGKKMASAGADWRTNPETQIKWGLKYIENRYETPCGAWSAFKQKGWY
jgi:hypothetical protein